MSGTPSAISIAAKLVAGVGKAPRVTTRVEKGSETGHEGDRECRARARPQHPSGCLSAYIVYDPRAQASASGSILPLDRASVPSERPTPAVSPTPEPAGTFGRNGQPIDLLGEGPQMPNCQRRVQWRFLMIFIVTLRARRNSGRSSKNFIQAEGVSSAKRPLCNRQTYVRAVSLHDQRIV
jgi:hypothetical protein